MTSNPGSVAFFMTLEILFKILTLTPSEAIDHVTDFPEFRRLRDEMVTICKRESNCSEVSVHAKDSKHAASMYRNAVRVGWLDPEKCHHHRVKSFADIARFGVRGPFGTSAAYTLWHLGGCLPPEVLDVPMFAALATAKRMVYQCKQHGACDKQSRHRLWAGAARFDRRKEPNC